MQPRKYSIPINGKDFEFDWDKDTEPTDDEIISIYKSSLEKLKPIKPTASHNVETTSKPLFEILPKQQNHLTDTIVPKERGMFDWVNEPLVQSNIGHTISDSISKPTSGNVPWAMLKGFTGGALEGVDDVVSNLTTPIDLAAMALQVSPAKKAANIITGLRGAWNTSKGLYEGDAGKTGAGLLEGLLSLAGYHGASTPKDIPTQIGTIDPLTAPVSKPVIKPSGPVALPDVKVNPIEGGLSTKTEATRTPSLANEMYGIRDTGSDGFGSVPARMKTGTNQIVMDALLPSSIKNKIKQTIPLNEPAIAAEDLANHVIPEPIKNVIKDESMPKEIKDAAQQVVKLRSQDTSFGKALEPYIKSGLSTLESDSEAGKNIARLVQKTRIEGDQLAGQWSNRFKSFTKDLDETEWNNFLEGVEGRGIPFDKKVLKAVMDYRLLDDEVTKAAENAGMVMEDYGGNVIPFKGQRNYWPRIYSDDFVKGKQEDIFNSLIEQGHSPKEAQAILESSHKFGNRLISPQHARQADIAGYRTDPEAYLLHLDQMGKRIAESKNFGARDLGDVKSPLSQLVSQTRDKENVVNILNKHLGRVKPENAASDTWVNKANSLAAMTDLGLFTISNQAQKAPIAIRGDLSAFGKALKEFKTKAGQDWAEQSGALQTALRDSIQDLGGEHWVNRLYRTGASERSNRTLASLTGKFTAESDLIRAKKGDAKSIDRLKDLLLLDDAGVKEVAKQEFLTPEQLYTAGSRMSEMTQGRAGSIDLPPKWKSSPEAKLMSMYKGYAFRQTKAMKDAFLADPKKFLAIGLPLLAATGEVVGDTKAAIRAGLDPNLDVDDAISQRGQKNLVDNILKSADTPEKERQLASRVIENLSEAWTLGILSDMISSSGENPTGLLKFLAGPVPGMAADMAYGASKSVANLDIKPVASHVVKNLVPSPVGYPLSKTIAGKEKSKKSSMMPRLPSLTR